MKLSADFRVDPADFERDLAAIRAVREPVFLVEQQVPADLEWDDLDATSKHVVATDLDGRPIGTGRLTPLQRIGRMAVVENWRGRGVGEAILMRLLDQARELGYQDIELHAQTHAMGFYERAGFSAIGDEFMEAGIPHRTMSMRLKPAEPRPLPAPLAQHERAIESELACQQAALELLRTAKHKLWIYSRALDPDLFCSSAALDEFRRIATSGRGAAIRILVQDPGAALRPAAALIGLAQRLTSTMSLRSPTDEIDLQYPAAFLLNDDGGYLFRPLGSRHDGGFNPSGAGRQRQLQESFEHIWERSAQPDELRAMRL